MSDLAVRPRKLQPPTETVSFLASILCGENVRLINLDTTNPNGGRGGSLDSDQCAWLVRELVRQPDRGVIIASRHRSHELRNKETAANAAPRVLGDELVPLLMGHANVLAWISGNRHRPAATRHGTRDSALWELTPSLLGFGCKAWLGLLQRRSVTFSDEGVRRPPTLLLATA